MNTSPPEFYHTLTICTLKLLYNIGTLLLKITTTGSSTEDVLLNRAVGAGAAGVAASGPKLRPQKF